MRRSQCSLATGFPSRMSVVSVRQLLSVDASVFSVLSVSPAYHRLTVLRELIAGQHLANTDITASVTRQPLTYNSLIDDDGSGLPSTTSACHHHTYTHTYIIILLYLIED